MTMTGVTCLVWMVPAYHLPTKTEDHTGLDTPGFNVLENKKRRCNAIGYAGLSKLGLVDEGLSLQDQQIPIFVVVHRVGWPRGVRLVVFIDDDCQPDIELNGTSFKEILQFEQRQRPRLLPLRTSTEPDPYKQMRREQQKQSQRDGELERQKTSAEMVNAAKEKELADAKKNNSTTTV